ncbi:MAG: type II toxin-antitoxin system RelE/ParE family toxin, partial [Methylovirgula sp.]
MPHRLAPRARADLEEIWHYIAVEAGNESAADRTIDLIAERFLLVIWLAAIRARAKRSATRSAQLPSRK